jgi:hypothetical protein
LMSALYSVSHIISAVIHTQRLVDRSTNSGNNNPQSTIDGLSLILPTNFAKGRMNYVGIAR